MEGLAFDTAFIIALALPGLFFYFGYSRASGGWEITFTEEGKVSPRAIIYSIVISLFVHTIWTFLSSHVCNQQVDFDTVFALLTGSEINVAITFVELKNFSIYLISLSLASWVAGFLSGFGIAHLPFYDFEKEIALRSNGAHWYRLLTYPQLPSGLDTPPPTDVVVTVRTTSQEYIGLCWKYRIDRISGGLISIILSGAHIAVGKDPQTGKQLWDAIEGEFFDIQCGNNLLSLEVDYVWLDEENGKKDKPKFWRRIKCKLCELLNLQPNQLRAMF